MRTKGKPSGINKPDGKEGTGIPSNYNPSTQKKDHRATRKYTDHDERLAEHIRARHPNRNVDKTEATNRGGYKN